MAKATSRTRAEQIAIAAVGKAFPSTTSKNAGKSIREGESNSVQATLTIDGVISRGNASEQAASAAPLQEALLAVLAEGVDPRTLAAKRRKAMSIVKAAIKAGCKVTDQINKTQPEYASLLASIKSDAAKHLKATTKQGSLRFTGDYELTDVKVSAA